MHVICLEEEAFYKLLDTAIEHIDRKLDKEPSRWIDGAEAMEILKISSKSTLQKMRDEGRIRFSQPQKKIILYDRHSIEDYINQHIREPF